MAQFENAQAWSLNAIKEALGDELIEIKGPLSGASFGPVTTDSRAIELGSIFVAIRGERFDGHNFAIRATEQGARVLILERSVGSQATEFIVKDTKLAYGALAAAWRAQYSIPVICVVGANGKTTTTQMIAGILRQACGDHAVATEGNFNNEIGVPRTLLRFSSQTKAAVVEAGISHPGEMAQLVNWIRPTVVVITNAQREHQEFLKNVEGSARENGLAIVALSAKGWAVLPQSDPCFSIWANLAKARGCRVLRYAQGADSELSASMEHQTVTLKAVAPKVIQCRHIDNCDWQEQFDVNVLGDHAVHDLAAAASACWVAGIPRQYIVAGLSSFEPVKGRGKQYRLASSALLIDDSYNANPDSMKAAIDVVSKSLSPRIMVLGDMAEVGDNSEAYHREIGQYARDKGIERLITIGQSMRFAQEEFGPSALHFEDLNQLTERVIQELRQPATVLVKASNCMQLGQVVSQAITQIGLSK